MIRSIYSIPHLEDIKKIREYEQIIQNETQVAVRDISHWNSGDEYRQSILSCYHSNSPMEFTDYHYSYEYGENSKQQIVSRLVHSSMSMYNCVLIHNATAAICCISDYLYKHNFKSICVLEPSYFSTSACLKSFGLNVHSESIILNQKGEAELPYETLMNKNYDVLWITSPIFSTGIYFSQTQIDVVNSLAEKGILLVIDESASAPNKTLISQIHCKPNAIAIFSPHKYLAINSVKFAAIVCVSPICTYLEDWIDVFAGALPLSTCIAINHFLSSNYNECLDIHDIYIHKNIALIQQLCAFFPDNCCAAGDANYLTIYNKKLPFCNMLSQINMYEIMRNTHVSFVPGYINGFSKAWGFCYRVNLTLETRMLKDALGRLFNYFL